MTKKRMFAIVFFLLLPTALSLMNTTLSGEESLYSGTVKDGATVSVDNLEFEFKVASEGAVLIRYDNQGIIIMEGDCKYKDNLHICVGSISWAYRNLTIWKDIYQANVDISVIKGTLGITRNIEKTKLLIDETSKVEVFLQNTGNREIKNVVYQDNYPDSFSISDVKGCYLSKKNNSIEWKGDIEPSIIEKCSYTLTGLKGYKYDSKAEASYFDGVSIEAAYSNEAEIEVQNYSLNAKPYLNKNKLEIGDFVNLSIVLENINEDEKISVWSFKIEIPTDLKILKKSGELDKKEQILSWNGDLESNEIKNFTVDMTAENAGNITIYIKEAYKEGSFRREFTKPIKLSVYCDCISVRYNIPNKIVEGKETNFNVDIFNPSYENKFNDIKVDVLTNIPDAKISKTYPVLDERQSITLFSDKIIIPKEGFYYYNVSVRYKSEYKQYFKNKKHILIKGEVVEEVEESEEISEAVKAEEEKILENTTAAENVTKKDIETTIIKMDKKRLPLNYILMGLAALVVFGIVIGIIKIKKAKKVKQLPNLAPLLTFLFLIFVISLFLFSTSSITGFSVHNLDVDYIKENLSVLGAMVVIFVFLLIVIYKKEFIERL